VGQSAQLEPLYQITYIISYISYHSISYRTYYIIYILSYRHVMLCHIMSCYVMPCHVVSCHVMLCYVMSCHVVMLSCYVMSCHFMLFHVMSCHVTLCVVLCYLYKQYATYKPQDSFPPDREIQNRCGTQLTTHLLDLKVT
jgi:hypothetical protein